MQLKCCNFSACVSIAVFALINLQTVSTQDESVDYVIVIDCL